MRKFSKTIAAIIAAVTSTAFITISAGAYSLDYAIGTPSYLNTLQCTDSTPATGAQYISVNSQTFYTYIAGAGVSAVGSCESITTNQLNIYQTSPYPYRLYYNGSTPLINKTVYVDFALFNYVASQQVSASGTISA